MLDQLTATCSPHGLRTFGGPVAWLAEVPAPALPQPFVPQMVDGVEPAAGAGVVPSARRPDWMSERQRGKMAHGRRDDDEHP